VRGEEVVAAAVLRCRIGGENMLEETLGGSSGERGREGRERGGEAANTEAAEHGGEVTCRLLGGSGGQRSGKLGGGGIGDR
jgi:hypothetical protein